MTDLLDVLIACILLAFLTLLVVSRIRKARSVAESSFLVRIYLGTLALRAGLALFLNNYSADTAFLLAFWGDSAQYDSGGWLMALSWEGEQFYSSGVARSVSGYGFVYFVAAVYSLFGRNQLLVQFLNATIGSLTVLVIYATAKLLFGERPARWAAKFAAFFPQMIFWSAGMYKDPATQLCIAVSMYAVLRLREQLSVRHAVAFVAALLALMTLRFYVFYFVLFATLGTFAFSQRRGLLGSIAVYSLLLGTFLAAFSLVVRQETLDRQMAYLDLEQVQLARRDQATAGGSGYGAKTDIRTQEGLVATLPVGLVYLLFAPFPWAISGIRQILTLPETLVWYALMPALARGLLHTIRHKLRDTLPILAFTAALTLAYAVFQTNVGTAYRQRTQISMFFFIFIGVGLELRRTAAELRRRPGLHGRRPAATLEAR